jgi:hypothetical protein
MERATGLLIKLSRFMLNPDIDYLHALKRVMRYLCGTSMSYGFIQDTLLCLKDIVT